jgi:hypothetical protein
MKFRKKPVVIDAEQWFPGKAVPGVEPYGDPDPRVNEHMLEVLASRWPGIDAEGFGWCRTFECGVIVFPGDWIITDAQGARYPCKPDIFAATYDEFHGEPLTPGQSGGGG